jgi:hypothetical protein
LPTHRQDSHTEEVLVLRRTLVPITVVIACVLAFAGPSTAAGQPSSAIDGVISPLSFAFAPDGAVYVSQSFAGELIRVDRNGDRTTINTTEDGLFVGGVAVARGGTRILYTASLPPEFAEGPPSDTTLETVTRTGSSVRQVSLLDYEAANNPDASNLYGIIDEGDCLDSVNALSDFLGPASYPGVIESNPYAVVGDRGDTAVVADAAGNSLLRVSRTGKVSTIAVLPPIPQTLSQDALDSTIAEINGVLEELGEDPLPEDALNACVGAMYQSNPVPTDVEIGPGGHYYVSALPGFPESAGSGAVFRVNRTSGAVAQVASGFTGAVDLAVERDGTIHVAELFAFQVSTVQPGDDQASSSTFVECPTAVELDHQGRVWVAEGGICTDGPPAAGRITPLG